MEVLFLIGRILFGGVFLMFGLMHFMKKKEMIEWIKTKEVGVPVLANFVAGLILVLSGICIVFGIFPQVAFILLIIFLIVVSFVMHDFWNIKNDNKEKMNQIIFFMYNVALLGANIMLLWINYWPLSL